MPVHGRGAKWPVGRLVRKCNPRKDQNVGKNQKTHNHVSRVETSDGVENRAVDIRARGQGLQVIAIFLPLNDQEYRTSTSVMIRANRPRGDCPPLSAALPRP